ncbi:hypothetical protein SMMN14_01014 [Sphaerulina musiva]
MQQVNGSIGLTPWQSFTSLLGSIGGPKQNQAPAQNASAGASASASRAVQKPDATTSTPSISRPNANSHVAAGTKRKPEEQITAPPAKAMRVDVKTPVPPSGLSRVAQRGTLVSPSTHTPPRGTTKPGPAKDNPKANESLKSRTVLQRPAPSTPATTAATTPGGSVAKPKRGFASIMEKAKAAQEAAKAAGSSTIKHKPVEKLTKKERLKLEEEAKLKTGPKTSKALAGRSRSGTPADGRCSSNKNEPEAGYKGTMKKTPVQPQIAYKGTMKKSEPGAPPGKAAVKKGLGQDKYGGYASWSDLDDAEEDEDGYGSEGSDDMDAGFDDMALEEEMALRAARKEDQEALEEEERHKREKLERKKKLEALSKSAAARKRF